jgi:hypothetical protein
MARDSGTGYLWAGLAAYGAAKWFELSDETIFALGGIVSGHTFDSFRSLRHDEICDRLHWRAHNSFGVLPS